MNDAQSSSNSIENRLEQESLVYKFARNFRRFRHLVLQIEQYDVARDVNKRQADISKWETGKRSPNLDNLQ